ncbi:ParB/RepB/Spo0J family partition protein [Lignipirellula cremea]|uniref:Chromosome-partitioning protein Spo0J n=1 Tax=Lignipirellula cremea TaxID=2528010 RepID=A0A518DTP9_9BACT|nr:ParB/RepB/Spo0J family partition protein [Lignipirellula cremea]QDU95209.1 Chromosome-partitioning protein Spo0J [Lignipirellula cremea]
MTKKRRLGRGLEALLGSPIDEAPEYDDDSGDDVATLAPPKPAPRPAAAPSPEAEPEAHANGALLLIGVHEIAENPFQPRREFNEPEIASLAESLREHDMLQPVLVRAVGDGYQLISGERRLRAAILAGWTTVPARLREADDRLVAELAIVENLQRKDLNPIEKAISFRQYLEQHQCSQEDLAKRLTIDRSTIANLVRLLELPEDAQRALREGRITAGHARALLPLGDEHEQLSFCHSIEHEGWSVRETERQVQQKIRDESPLPDNGSSAVKKKGAPVSQQVASLEQEIRIAVGSKVDIRQTAKGRGKIILHFTSHEEFERLHAVLTDTQELSQRAG